LDGRPLRELDELVRVDGGTGGGLAAPYDDAVEGVGGVSGDQRSHGSLEVVQVLRCRSGQAHGRAGISSLDEHERPVVLGKDGSDVVTCNGGCYWQRWRDEQDGGDGAIHLDE